jgi:hypothetical protein
MFCLRNVNYEETFHFVPGKKPSIPRRNPMGPSTIGTIAQENPIHWIVWSVGLLFVELIEAM